MLATYVPPAGFVQCPSMLRYLISMGKRGSSWNLLRCSSMGLREYARMSNGPVSSKDPYAHKDRPSAHKGRPYA